MGKLNITDIRKFNPYHDERGRFTSGSGATSFTIRTRDPSKQYLADRAVQRAKEAHANANSRLTPPRVAGAIKGMEMSHEEANFMSCNPNYSLSASFRGNCQSCVPTYEMRRRGYDVEAQEYLGEALPLQRKTAKEQINAWENVDGSPAMYEGRQRMGELREDFGMKVADPLTPKRAQAEIEALIGEGRYALEYATKGTRNSGHIVVAERINGKIRIYDPQSGRTNTLEQEIKGMRLQASRVNGRVKYNMHPLVMRMDNKVIKEDYAKELMQPIL